MGNWRTDKGFLSQSCMAFRILGTRKASEPVLPEAFISGGYPLQGSSWRGVSDVEGADEISVNGMNSSFAAVTNTPEV